MSNKPNVMNFAQALRMKPGAAKAPPKSEAPPIPAAPTEKIPEPLQNGGAAKTVPPPKFIAPSDSVVAAETAHTRVPNEIFETVMPTLKPGAQVVLWRLYRLSAGFNSQTCHVSIGKLAAMTHISPTQVREFLKYLEGRGWIRRLNVDLSNKNQDARGITFEVRLPRLAPAKSVGGSKSVAPPNSEPNKLKALKESNKREVAPPDYKNCPDCQGSGFYYPEGIERGVAKCKHEQLREGKSQLREE